MNKRLELRKFGQPLVLTGGPVPEPPHGGAVVKLHYTGICHSDVHLSEGKTDLGGGMVVSLGDSPTARVLGHEMSGEVHSLGSDVTKDDTDLRVGDHVIVYPWPGCGDCGLCRAGNNLICPKQRVTQLGGTYCDGGYQNYVSIARVTWLHRVPKGLSMELAAIISCSGITAYNAISALYDHVKLFIKCKGAATVLIIGAGGVGLWGIEIAKAIMPEGTTIAVAEISETKFPAARKAGADKTILWNPKASPIENASRTRRSLGGVHAVADFVGTSNTSTASFGCLKPGAKMVVVGLHGGATTAPNPLLAVMNITVSGVYVGSRRHLVELIKLIADGKVKGPPINHVTLEDTHHVLRKLRQGTATGRMVISHL